MAPALRRLLLAAILLVAVPAFAAPVGYGFDSGFIQVSAVRSSDNSLVWSGTLTLGGNGANNYVIWDSTGTPTGFGLGTIEDFQFVTVPNQGPFSTVQTWGPFDTFAVDSATISAAPGFATSISVPLGGGNFDPVSAGPLLIDAFYSASHTSGFPPPVNGVPADIIPTSGLTGSVELVGGGLELHINNAIMGTFLGSNVGELDDLEITGDITWFGSTGSFIPEPSTGLLLGMGLVGLAARRRGAAR